jgi:hypothetical protein
MPTNEALDQSRPFIGLPVHSTVAPHPGHIERLRALILPLDQQNSLRRILGVYREDDGG